MLSYMVHHYLNGLKKKILLIVSLTKDLSKQKNNFATNGLKSLGIKKNYNFPITLTASMTRPLTDDEFEDLGKPKEWECYQLTNGCYD